MLWKKDAQLANLPALADLGTAAVARVAPEPRWGGRCLRAVGSRIADLERALAVDATARRSARREAEPARDSTT